MSRILPVIPIPEEMGGEVASSSSDLTAADSAAGDSSFRGKVLTDTLHSGVSIIDAGKVRSAIFQLAWPTLGENLLRMMVMGFDTAIVGRLGAEAVAVVGLAWSLIFFFFMVVFGLNQGTVAVVSRYVGAGDMESARRAAGQSIVLNLMLGCVVSAILITQAENLFVLMGAEPAVIEQGAVFIRVLGSIYTADVLLVSSNAILRAAGDTRTPMMIVGGTNILTVILEIGLVYGKFGLPAHGVMGSALAFSLMRLVSMFLAFGGLMFNWYRIRLSWQDLYPLRRDMMGKVLAIAWPSMLEQLVYSSASLVFIRIVSQLGTVAIAVNSVLLRAESFAYMPGLAFSVAGGILVGQSLGAGDRERARFAAWESAKLGMLVMGGVGLFFLVFPGWIVGIFSTDPAVIVPASVILLSIAVIEPVQGLMFVLMGVFKGAGDTRTTMKLSCIGVWLFRVPFAYFFAIKLGAGVAGAWAAMCLHIGFVAFFALRHFRRGSWLDVKV